MESNYEQVIQDNLSRAFAQPPESLAAHLPAEITGGVLHFRAFGRDCEATADSIRLDGEPETGAQGVVISLYLGSASPEVAVIEPLQAYKDFPDTMPYWGAFRTHTESILVPHVQRIRHLRRDLLREMGGREALENPSGDFAFLLQPLPKIFLCYIFYEADEDFPASATCLYSHNADRFIPVDGLADVGEYTSREIIRRLE